VVSFPTDENTVNIHTASTTGAQSKTKGTQWENSSCNEAVTL